MTETDLRFAFHMDTGSMPFWDPNQWMVKVLREGHPTSEYGQWLEERAGNARWLQRAYQFENKYAPIYKSKIKSWYKSVYSANYIFWLEQEILKKHPQVIKSIIHI